MPLIEFPYTLHKGYLLPIIPISINSHKVWVFVDSGATFSILSVDDAERIGVNWQSGRPQMIVVGDGSFIPTFIHDLPIQIGPSQLLLLLAFLSALESVSIFSDALVCSINFRFASMIEPAG